MKTLAGLFDLDMVASDEFNFKNAEAALDKIDNTPSYVSESRVLYGAKIN